MENIYFDYSASTPVEPAVLAAMAPYFSECFGNPGSIHALGREAMQALDDARSTIAAEIGANFEEIVFTASASEANDLVIDGIFEGSGMAKPKIIISAIEHESVSETAANLKAKGATIVVLPVSPDGFVDSADLREALDEHTILISVIHASNDVGSIEPIEELGAVIEAFRKERHSRYPLFHSDAAQSPAFIKLDVGQLGLDAMTLSAQKIYGPKGAGCLYIKRDFLPDLRPQLVGGSHEFGLRASTPNVPALVGFAKALTLVSEERVSFRAHAQALRDQFWQGILEICPEAKLNASSLNRLPNNLNVYFPGQEDQNLVIKLDMVGILASAGSACSARTSKVSPVVLALGHSPERARASIRLTLGRGTTQAEIKDALARMAKIL